MTDSYMKIESLNLSLGNFSLKDITLSCAGSEYHVLLGPTGSGKSSLMKCILGFHQPDSGYIYLNGRNICNDLPETRNMGYVPQNYSLFPHLDAERNIRFGLEVRRNPAGNDDRIVDKLCNILGIQYLRHREIQFLSGGERQKVAIARALAIQPDILLLDEPFSSIDEGAKRNLWMELREIVKEIGITTFHITHNLEEAYTMGEQLSVLIRGELLQSGLKNDIFEKPSTRYIARFLNYRNIYEGITEKSEKGTKINAEYFSIFIPRKIQQGRKVWFCVRQQDLKIIKHDCPVKESLKQNIFEGKIISLFSLPEYCLMTFRIKNSPRSHDFELRFPRYLLERHNLYAGKDVNVAILEPNIIIFDE